MSTVGRGAGSSARGAAPGGVESAAAPWPYLVFLLGYLTLAAFFDAYAAAFRSRMTPYVGEDFGVPLADMLRLLAWVYVGSLLGFVPRLAADLFGRRIVLLAVAGGVCGLQWLVGLARSPEQYALLLALLAALSRSDLWTLVMSEEAPRHRRGLWAALPGLLGATGAVALAALLARMGGDPGAWRDVARFPLWGLVVTVACALVMRETHAFTRVREERRRSGVATLLAEPFRHGLGRPLLVLTALKVVYTAGATAAMALAGAVLLRAGDGLDAARAGLLVQVQAATMAIGAVAAGWASDRFGRLSTGRVAALGYGGALVAMAAAPAGGPVLAGCYLLQAFFDAGVLWTLRLATLETFPTHVRSTGAAWTELVPAVAALLAAQVVSALVAAGLGPAGAIVAIAALAVLVVPLFGLLHETRGADLAATP